MNNTSSNSLILVGCVKQKQSRPSPAAQLYTSALFRKRMTFAQRFGARWLILSALHGVVEPAQELAPYDVTLLKMPKADRVAWAARVITQLEPHLVGIEEVVMLAGARYGEFLVPALEERGFHIVQPLQGVRGVGTQQTWLQQAVAAGRWSA